MLRYCTSSCTSSHTWCYATVRLLALPHIHDATLLYVFLHFLTYMMLRYCTSSCTSSHTWCYATVRLLALPHIHDATLLYVFCISSHTWCYTTVFFLHFLTYMMLRYCTFSCTSSHTWCYATVRLLALPHIHDATLLYIFLHFLTYMMLRYCTSSCTSSLRKRRRSGALSVHTGTIDNAWRLLKQAVPKSLASKKGHTYNPALFKHCRSWQWRWKNTGTSLFQKTAKVLNETVQSRWLSLAIEKTRAEMC